MKENTLLEIVEAYVFDGVEVIINDGKVIGYKRWKGNRLSTTHHTSVMGLHLPCSTSKTPTF